MRESRACSGNKVLFILEEVKETILDFSQGTVKLVLARSIS